MDPPIWSIDYETLAEILELEYLYGPKMYWQPGDPLPPWKPPTKKADLEKYRWAMIDFVEWAYCQQPDPEMKHSPSEVYELIQHGLEIELARNGDIEPLRRAYPHLAEFLHAPAGPVGKRKTGGLYPTSSRAQWAASTVTDVKAIWQRYYGKKVRRFTPTAEEIVANIFGVTTTDVRRALNLNKLRKHRETVSS